MIHETELTLFVPSPELLVRLASGERPLGIPAGPPRITVLRETYFDTPDLALRRRGMTCKLRQVEGEEPDLVVTVGEGPDSEGITSRNRLTASAVGFGVFETLRSESEAALQVRKFVDPARLRPQIALDIQRLGRVYRSPVLRRAILLLFFDRITAQAGTASATFHELRIRRRRKGGPLIRDLAQELRDRLHLFPDGLSTLHRAHRILALEGKQGESDLSPYALSLALSVFSRGRIGLQRRGSDLVIPTFRGSGEDAARALSEDLIGTGGVEMLRLGSTEPREGRPMLEVWAIPEHQPSREEEDGRGHLVWCDWHDLMEAVGRSELRSPTLIAALLLLTRRRLLGQLPWIPTRDRTSPPPPWKDRDEGAAFPPAESAEAVLGALAPALRTVEDGERSLRERLAAASGLSRGISRFFMEEVARTKGRILSQEGVEPSVLLDILSIRVRGIIDRLYACLQSDLLPGLEAAGIHLRPWAGLMREDRRVLQDLFRERHLPSIRVAEEWGPSFVPEMPPMGCAVGLSARCPGWERTRFFHLVLDDRTPSFLGVPGTTVVVPLEEVVRGFFFSQHPDLERGETYVFRFTTSEVTVPGSRVPAPGEGEGGLPTSGREPKRRIPGGGEGEAGPRLDSLGVLAAIHQPIATPVPEERKSVVLRVLVGREMPEVYQAHLIRALERQVSRRVPLIGWPDLYPVNGPLDLGGLEALLPPEA